MKNQTPADLITLDSSEFFVTFTFARTEHFYFNATRNLLIFYWNPHACAWLHPHAAVLTSLKVRLNDVFMMRIYTQYLFNLIFFAVYKPRS